MSAHMLMSWCGGMLFAFAILFLVSLLLMPAHTREEFTARICFVFTLALVGGWMQVVGRALRVGVLTLPGF